MTSNKDFVFALIKTPPQHKRKWDKAFLPYPTVQKKWDKAQIDLSHFNNLI